MVVELYQLLYADDKKESNDDNKNWAINADWVKWQMENENIPHRQGQVERILNLRLHWLILFLKLIRKGTILLDCVGINFVDTAFSIASDEKSTISEIGQKLKRKLSFIDTGSEENHASNGFVSIIRLDINQNNGFCPISEKITSRNDTGPSLIQLCQKLPGNVLNTFRIRDRNEKKRKKSISYSECEIRIFVGAVPVGRTKPHLTLARYTDERGENRLVIIILGPIDTEWDYGELGRFIYDLMGNRTFRRVLIQANSISCLLTGITGLFDHSIVLPPGQLHNMQELDIKRVRRALVLPSSEITVKTDFDKAKNGDTNLPRDNIYNPLERTGKLFNGFILDIKQRYKIYSSDIKDAFHYKCLVSTVLIFFVTFATAIGLGEILRSKTQGLMGLSETLVSMCLCGVIWGLFSGQPLIIQTKTAAFVIIEGGLFAFCEAHDLDFMIVRVWTGVWVFPITLVMVAFEAPVLIRYVTRFTEEMIDTLISVVLIFESLQFLIDTYQDNPLLYLREYCHFNRYNASGHENISHPRAKWRGSGSGDDNGEWMGLITGTDTGQIGIGMSKMPPTNQHFISELHNQPNTALLTLVLFISTFFLSLYLERMKQSRYFSHTIRKAIGNFSIPITIPLMTLAADTLFKRTYIHKLDMPVTFSPTRPTLRGWFINPFDQSLDPFPIWAIFASILPAVLFTILLFVELELTEHELSLKERGLKKGSGFHLDLVLSGFLMLLCGFIGIPWLGAGCVESFSHANALTVHKKSNIHDGQPKVERVVEQRVTTILVALLQGACAFQGEYLRKIPIAVLMGIFVHLSITNLTMIQFVQRVVLYIVPRKYYPDKSYCQKVPMGRMHLYTTIQVLCFSALFGVEVVGRVCILFPMVVGIIALIRCLALPRIFSDDELNWLDAEDDSDSADETNDTPF